MFSFFVIVGTLAAICASYFAKLWAIDSKWYFYVLAIALFFVGGNAMIFSIKYGGISMAIVATQLARIIVGASLGFFLFHEKVSTQQLIGICFAIPALILLIFPSK